MSCFLFFSVVFKRCLSASSASQELDSQDQLIDSQTPNFSDSSDFEVQREIRRMEVARKSGQLAMLSNCLHTMGVPCPDSFTAMLKLNVMNSIEILSIINFNSIFRSLSPK